MTPTPTLTLNLTSSWSLHLVLSESSPAVGCALLTPLWVRSFPQRLLLFYPLWVRSLSAAHTHLHKTTHPQRTALAHQPTHSLTPTDPPASTCHPALPPASGPPTCPPPAKRPTPHHIRPARTHATRLRAHTDSDKPCWLRNVGRFGRPFLRCSELMAPSCWHGLW